MSGLGLPETVLARVFRLRGPVDVERLGGAVSRLVLRRDALRSRFEMINDRPWQLFQPPGEGPGLLCSELLPDESAALAWVQEHVTGDFPLWGGPLVRFGLARFGPEDHLLAVACSHLVSDGWTMDLVLADLAALHNGSPAGEAPSFAAWARRRGAQLAEVGPQERAFWREQFPEPPAGLGLPAPLAEPATAAAPPTAVIAPEAAAALRRVAAADSASLYLLLLAAVHTTLARERGRRQLTYAVNVANRDDAAAEATVGCLTHRTLIQLGGDGPEEEFSDVLADAVRRFPAVLEHSRTPFRVLRGWLAEWHGRETPENELVYVVLSHEWGGTVELAGLDAVPVTLPGVDPGSAGLEFWFTEGEHGLDLALRYPPGRFTGAEAEALVRAVAGLLNSLADNES